jgi:hypothetical protein
MSNPAPVPIERFAWFVRALVQAVVTRALYQFIVQPQAGWVIGRLQTARDKFRRLAERIAAGTYQPREIVTRSPPPPPATKNPARHVVPRRRGWLAELLPDAPRYRGFLLGLIHEPETQKLIAAAPAEMARLLRPNCWMLKAEPPEFLSRPRRAEPPAAAEPATAQPRRAPPAAKPRWPCLPRTHAPAPAPKPRAARPPRQKA